MTGTLMTGKEFVARLVDEMDQLFARLGETETLEAESEGKVDVETLLRLALKSELEASELAGFWLPTTPEVDAKMALALQCGDEMRVAMTERVDRHAGGEIEIALAVGADQPRALAALEGDVGPGEYGEQMRLPDRRRPGALGHSGHLSLAVT